MQPPCPVGAIVFLGVLGLVSIAGAEAGGSVEEGRGPVFLHEPPSRLHFSNTTGALLPCSAHGSPPPRVEWLTGGEVVTEVADVRVVHTNGSLQFLPFPPYAYTAVVHAATYSCRASSSAGTILSRPVHVRAVVRQYYEVQVYDEFVISGNTAVIKCHVPSFVRDYVSVTSWVRGNGERIVSDVLTGGRYSVFGTGELHIRHVTKADEFQSYHCETQHVLTGETTVSAVAGRLMVNEPRSSVPPRITDSRSTVTASVRDTVELPCAAQGYPIPQYQWHRISGKVEVAVVQDGRIQQVGGSLLIRQVTAADAGRYVCVVSSSVDSERAHTTLEVWAPLTAHISPQVQTVDVGGVATFNCSPEGFPQDTITWLKDGEPLEVSDRVRVVRERSVVIEDVRRDDRGMYQCLVSNLEGTAQGSAQLKLGDAAPQWLDTSGPQVVSPGATVTLVCVVQGSPPPALSWTLRGLPALTSDPRISVSQSVDGEKVTGRLNISSVRVEDGGQWSCLAENRAGKVDHTGRLNVRGPPSIRPMRPVSVVAGRTARFNCIVAGFPIESIYWEKNGVVLPVSERQEVHQNGTLEVHEVSREADSGQYTCVAVAGENTARANLQVNVMVPPLIDERIFSLGSGFPAKSKARIMCVVERGDLPLTFTWTHDGRPLTPGPTISVRSLDEFTSVLLFDSLRKDDGGRYTCTATNAVASSSRTVKLVVKVAPTWKLEPDDSSVVVGSDLVIPCAAHGSPTPTITWRRAEGAVPRQYRPVTTLGDNVDVAMNSSLVIMNIKRDQGGEFLCSASNGVGSDLSKSVRVTVKVPPQFEEHEENVTVTAGQRARLTCESHGDLPITAIWSTGNPPTRISSSDSSKGRLTIKETILSDDSSLSSSSSSSSSSGTLSEEGEEGFRSVLTVNTKSRHDSKVFYCLASNVYGNDTKRVNLIVQEVPGTAGTPRVVDSGSRSVNITWSPPSHDGNSPISIYRILIINSTDSWMNVGRMKTMEVSRPVARVTGLKPAHSYLVRVVGVNSVGASPPSPEVKISTAHEPPTKPASNVRIIPISSTSLRVTWQPPDGIRLERAGLGYYIGYKVTNSSEPFRYQTLEPSAATLYRLEVTLKALHKFTSYMVTIQAFNSAGAGPRTTPVSATTEEDVPSEAPRDVQCTSLSSTSLLVQWTTPSLTAIHGILQGYKVMYRPVHPTRFFHPDDIKDKTIVALRTQLNGLERYTNYSVTVAAYTRRGSGIRSDPVYCITDEDVPGPVESVKALAVDSQSVLVAWRPPKAPNGVITKYTVHLDHPDQQVAPSSSWGGGGGATWGLPGSRSSSGSSWDVAGVAAETGGRSWVVSGSERQYLVANLSPTSSFGFTVRASTLVGEGPPGTRVTQRPRPDAPAAIASFSDKTIAVWGEELRLACRVVGNPSPVRTWTINGKVVPSGINRIKEYPDGSLLITDVKAVDAGNYTCTATNIHGSDAITYSVTVQASRDQGVPPSPPRVYVSDVTSTTITVRWSTANAGGAPILGYYLHEKKEFGEWRRMEVPADADSYTLTGLQCGTRYQVYVSAYNHVGVSPASDIIPTKTLGREPVVPGLSSLLRVNVTSIALNLAAWLDGGCPITSMVIEYRERGMPSWTLVSNHVRWDNTSEFLVLDLKPAMRYTLKVTAHNSAGSSIGSYPFTTLTYFGATLSPIIHDAVGVPPWYLDSHVLVAVVIACILVLLAVCVAVAYTCRRTRTQTQTYKEVNHVHNDLTPDSGLTSDTMLGGHSLEILEAYTPSTLPLGSYDEISPYATFRMPGENNKTPPPPPLPSRADTNSRLMPSLLQPVASVVESGYSRVKRKGPQLPDGGLPPTSRTAQPDHTYDKTNKAAKGKNVSRCPSVTEKVTSKEASGSSVTSMSSNHEELVRAYHAHANDTPTTPESGRRNKCGVATSSEITTESDTTAEPDLVSFCAAIGNSRALRVPALFKPADGDYSTVADMVGVRSRTESTTSHEESSDEAKGTRSHRRPPRGQECHARQQGHRPSRGDPDYSYARPVKKQGPPPPPLSSTESNSAEYADGWPSAGSEEAYSRRHTLEFSEAECDHPSAKKGVEALDQLMVDLEMEKIVFDTGKNSKVYTTAL